MNNNFMGFFDPTHNNFGMSPEFGRGPPGQQGGFGGMPPNMNPHGGMNMPGYQHHQRLLHYENNHMMGPLSPSMSSLPTAGPGIGPPSAGRMMEMNFSRMQHYRATQQSHMQHSPGSLSPMPGIGGSLSNQSPYGLRMPNLAPKQQMLEARLQSSLGNGITRWPRMPSVAGLSRPQMPQLLMNQGPMPMLQNTNDFHMGGSPTMSSADMLRYMKMDSDDAYAGPAMSVNAFDFPPSHPFPSSQNPYSMESQLSQPPPLKQSGGGQIPMSQSPLSFGQPQSLSYGPPVSKSFVDSYSKFMPQVPHSPKLTHFGPSPSNEIFDQPSNPLTPLAPQQKSPFSPFGNTFNENMNSPVGLQNLPQPLPMESTSPAMQTSSVDIRSPTKVNPLLNQIQQLKQQIAQLEGNPLTQGSPQLSMLKQQLDHTYLQFISQQRSGGFPAPKDSHRIPPTPQDFYLDKPPMTPRSHTDFSLDKPPPTPRPQPPPMNDFRMEKLPKPSSRAMSQSDFSFEKSLSQPHLQQDFMLKKSPQTPIGPPHPDIFDKPPMTPRPVQPHDFMIEKSQPQLPQNDYLLDNPPSTPRQKSQSGFVFGKPQIPLSQPQLTASRGDMNFSQAQLHLSQPSYFDKPPHTPRPQPMPQETMLEKTLPMPHPNTVPDYPVLDKIPPTPGTLSASQSQAGFNMVKSPIVTQTPMQLSIQPQQPQRPTHIQLQSPLRSPPSFFSQASQSPMSSISTPIHSVSQQQDADIDLKDDIAFLDELLQTKLNEPPEKHEQIGQPVSRKNSMNRAPNPMPVLDGMHTSAASPTLPPTMPVLAPSVLPPASMKYDVGMPDTSHGLVQSPMQPMPMPFPMQMPGGPMSMYAGMQDQAHLMMMHNVYGMNFGMMPASVRPPHLRNSNAKEKSKASKNSALKGSGLGPAAKKKKVVRRKSSESDTLIASPKTPVTPATPSSTSNASIVNPASNVSSVNSGESIAAVNPFMLDDNLADNAATRRSLRERKKRNYNDDYDYNISDDEEKKKAENGEQSNADISGGHKLIAYKPNDAVEGEIATIERILAGRIRSNVKDEEGHDVEEEEFCVKYKGYSYLHCEWGTEKELSKKDKRAPMKIKRFKTKRDPVAILSELDDEPFNPDFVEVDRVLDHSTCIDQVTGEPVTHYLVKWRSLSYEDSTWELEVNVDEPKIKQYLELKKPPPPEFQQYVPRPQAFQWKKIEKSPEYKDGNTLRDYQLESLNWLTFCWYKRQNCILADEMGLGKTVQSISLLCELKRYGVRGPFLVIAPLSTIVNWQREFEAWTDINTIVYHGSAPSRLLIQQYEMSYTDEKGEKIPGVYKFEAVVTTYEMILSENDMLSKIPWRCAVIDEAHRLKNKNCKLLEGLNKLQIEHRVLLTGTPLQNNVEELFSLLNFLEPTRFPSQAAFLLEFGNLKTEAQVEKLQQILKPMMLRRIKEDVEKNVPPKEETIIEVELTTIQKKFYRAILEKNLAFLTKGLSSASNTPNLMNAMMELRKCCNHPFLINGAEERIVSEYTNGAEGHETITKHFKAMTESSGKMVLIDKLLPKLKAGDHKVLIFSQMIRVLDLLEDYLLCKKYLYERIDGRVRGNARQAAIDRFCRADSDRFVFLLCTRAGGLGINLTAADTVIIFDSDWNPQNDLQAQARCHRIGQSKPVKIYRLICRNTYERDMFDKASRKLALDRAVLQNMNYMENSPSPALPGNTIPGGAYTGTSPFTGNGSIPGSDGSPLNPAQVQTQPVMSKKEIEDLLKRGAYGALMDEDGDASTKFCEEDIDQILERRTQVIQIVGEGKGSTFAKASFISNTAKMDIDVDDPDFWAKWAQKAAVDVKDVDKENLIIDKPRERKQTKRFGNEDGSVELSDAESVEEEEKPVVDAVRTAWSRVECFRVEKNMLVYGWGRWRDFLLHDNFKVQINEREVEAIARTILVFCLHHFKGDEKIKAFISSTITKSVTRSRIIGQDLTVKEIIKDEPYTPDSTDPSKQKKALKVPKRGTQNSKPVLIEAGADWKAVDPDTLIIDPGYRKHLAHHSKKILSRVKLLWCLRHEIIGNFAEKILLGLPASDIPLQVPHVDGEAPASWWDVEADKSLLIGIFKHGYDKYNTIKTDPCLCFASKLRLSDPEVEKNMTDQTLSERSEDDASGKRKRKRRLHDDDDFNSDDEADRDDDAELYSMAESPISTASPTNTNEAMNSQQSTLKWPQPPDLNTRLRRLITGYVKGCEKEQMKLAQQEKDKERRERQAQQIREKQLKKAEMALRWSRREVTDFYRVVTTFGVIYDEETETYDWSKFRKLAKLEKKDDERITAYYEEFSAMCRRVCRESTPEDLETKRGENLEPITDERAHRVLHRVNLLNMIRNKVLKHESLDERLTLCEPSNDFPVWWKAGTHDKELLIGVAKHGVGRADSHLFTDESLCFKGIVDSLALQLKKRKQEQLAKQNQNKDVTPADDSVPVSQPVNSTAADSQTTRTNETPSAGFDADRQPVATQHESNQPQAPPTEEKKENILEDTSVSKEVAEILAAWPKDKALLGRLEKICKCVLNNAWPENIRADFRSHSHATQSHPTLPGSFDRAELMRQPSVNVGGEDGPRGEMAEGMLSPDKNFKVTSLDGLKITVKKKRRRRTKEQMAAAAAAAAQLAQVPPPEHLKFPVNDIQVPGMGVLPNDKVRRRRKRKMEIADSTPKTSAQSPQDEPPLKVVPHPVQYTSVSESGPTDLKMTLNPSIILHVPANMDQRSGRMASSMGSPTLQSVSSHSPVSSAPSHVPDKPRITSPSIPHSIDSLVHSSTPSASGHISSGRPSTVDHLPNLSRQRSSESSDSSHPHRSTPDAASSQDGTSSQKVCGPETTPDHVDHPRSVESSRSTASSASSSRPVDHATVISPNVNPFEKSRSIGEANIFDMLPLHMQSSTSKEYKEPSYSNANSLFNAKSLKQKHDKHSRSETVTPPGLTNYLEGHKASAAMVALAAKLHSQAVSKTARPDRYFPNMESSPLLPHKGEEHSPKASMSSVMNIRSSPHQVTKASTISYRHSMPEDGSTHAKVSYSTSDNGKNANDAVKPAAVSVNSNLKPSQGDVNKYNKSIVGHPHSMASLLGSHPAITAPTTPSTSSFSSYPFLQKPSIEETHIGSKELTKGLHVEQPTTTHMTSTTESKPLQQSHFPHVPQSTPSVPVDASSPMSSKRSEMMPTANTSESSKPGHEKIPGEAVASATPSGRVPTSDALTKRGDVSSQMQSRVSEPSSSVHVRNATGNTKNVQPRNKVPRTIKTTQPKSVIKRVSQIVMKPGLTGDGGSFRGTIPGPNIPGSSTGQVPLPTTSPGNQSATSAAASFKDHSSSQMHQASRPVVSVSSSAALSHTKSQSIVSDAGIKDSSAKERSPEIEAKKSQSSKPEQAGTRASFERPFKPTKSVPASIAKSTTPLSSPLVSVSGVIHSQAAQPVRAVKTPMQSTTSATVAVTSRSVTPSLSSHSKPTAVSSAVQTSGTTSPQSVIKFSTDSKPAASSNVQKSVPVITSLPSLIKDVSSAGKTRLVKFSQSISTAGSIITVATSTPAKQPRSITLSANASSVISSGNAAKKPISLQIVAATSNVVACLSAAAGLSQVQSIVKPNLGRPMTSTETSVVSTILKVIPSLGSKPGHRKELSSSQCVTSSASQNCNIVKTVSQTAPTHPNSKSSMTSVPFTTAVKVTVVPQLSISSDGPQITSSPVMQSEGSLLRTVSSSSSVAASLNAKLVQRGVTTTKQARGAPVKPQGKSQRLSNVCTSPTSEDETEAASNAPVASRTRPSTRRITSLSALGPGPMKKGGRNTPVTSPKGATVVSPKGATVTSPKGAGSSKGQATSPVRCKASVAQAPITIPGIMTSKPGAKSVVHTVSGTVGVAKSLPSKIVTAVDKKTEGDQRKGEKDVPAETQYDISASGTQLPHSKIDSTVAALAKLNESITIQTTRTLTPVTDRPKKQKRSLASIVTDLASKGAHQTPISITAPSLVKDSKPTQLNDKASSHLSSKGDHTQDTKAKISSPIPEDKGTALLSEAKNSQFMEKTNANDSSQGHAKVKESPKTTEASQDRDPRSHLTSLVSKEEPSTPTPTRNALEETNDAKGSNAKPVKQSDDKTDHVDAVTSDESKKELLTARASLNDTEHNYSEKASASKQNEVR